MVIGVIIGEGMNLEGKINNLGNLIETKFQKRTIPYLLLKDS